MTQQMMQAVNYSPYIENSTDIVIGLSLRRIREEKSLSRSELAFCLEWSDQALKAYEEGCLPISASSLYTLCEVLEVGIDDFYDLAFK